jgi:hypothetical protein
MDQVQRMTTNDAFIRHTNKAVNLKIKRLFAVCVGSPYIPFFTVVFCCPDKYTMGRILSLFYKYKNKMQRKYKPQHKTSTRS